MSDKILVLGSNGSIGSEISRILKKQGHNLALATSRKVENDNQVQLNIATGEGLEDGFKDVDRAFLLVPPGYLNQEEIIKNLVDIAKKNNLKKVVLMTAMGADANPDGETAKGEIYLKNSGLNYNIIRPNWFMQNFNSYWIEGILTQQKIFVPLGQAKGSFIDTRDIAAVAAELLVNDTWNNQDFTLTGKDVLNHDEVATILSEVSGKKITYQDVNPEVMREKLIAGGIPSDYAEFLLSILSFFKLGYSAATTDSVKEITGREPISFHKYAEDYKNSF